MIIPTNLVLTLPYLLHLSILSGQGSLDLALKCFYTAGSGIPDCSMDVWELVDGYRYSGIDHEYQTCNLKISCSELVTFL